MTSAMPVAMTTTGVAILFFVSVNDLVIHPPYWQLSGKYQPLRTMSLGNYLSSLKVTSMIHRV